MNKKKCQVFFVPTPIGNLGDMTFRGVDVLNEVDIVFAEDTRKAFILLNHYSIKKPVYSFHKENEKKVIPEILSLVNNGKLVAVISEAGTPCISDPGESFVKELIANNINFSVLPGANAIIPAVVMSGFNMKNFFFYGFLSHKKSEKINQLEKLKSIEASLVFYESPHRAKETAKLILEIFKNRICLVREISKVFEEKIFIENFSDLEEVNYKGEFVIVVENNNIKPKDGLFEKSEDEIIQNLWRESFSSKEILKIMRVLGFKRNEVYKKIQDLM